MVCISIIIVEILADHAAESRSAVETRVGHSSVTSPVASEDSTFLDMPGNSSESEPLGLQDILSSTNRTETFGLDTAAKSAAYTSDEIYVENMWGEIRKTTPPPSGQTPLHDSTAKSDLQIIKLKGVVQTCHGRTRSEFSSIMKRHR